MTRLLRLLPLLLLVQLCGTYAQTYFTPISQITTDVAYGSGKTTSVSTATFRCTESLDGGSFTIGRNTFDVRCVAPRYTYLMSEYARVPRYTELHKEHSCLVGNLKQYTASVAYAVANANVTGVSPIGTLRVSNSSTDVSAAGRKPLFVAEAMAVAALAVAGYALNVANKAMETANAAIDLGNQNLDLIKKQQVVTSGLQAWQDRASTSISGIQTTLVGQSATIADLKAAAVTTQSNVGALNSMVVQMGENTAKGMSDLQSAIADTRSSITAGMDAQAVYFTNRLVNLTTSVNAQFLLTSKDIKYTMDQIQLAQSGLLGLTSNVFDLYQNRQLRHMITESYFESRASLDPLLSPTISDAGVGPQTGGLTGSDRRILLDSISLNFVEGYTLAGVAKRRLVNQIHNVYIDADYAVSTTRPWTTFQSLLKSIGPSATCSRRYIGTDVPLQADENPEDTSLSCRIWIEVVTQTCVAKAGTTAGWRNIKAGTAEAAQPIAIESDMCDANGVISLPSVLIRSFPDWMSYVETKACGASLDPAAGMQYFQFYIQSLGGIVYTPQDKSTCGYTLNQILIASADSATPSVFAHMFVLLQAGFPNMMPRVYAAEMKLYGRLPAGLTFETEPLSYTPTQINADGTVVYDGGADPHMCLNAYWLAMSADTVPLFSVLPYPEYGVTKSVIFSNANAGSCVAGSSDCYVVSDPAPSSISMENDMAFLLPSNFVMVGDPANWANGIYDVPDAMIAASPEVRAGINKVDYFNMPPGTTVTQSLDAFNRAHNGEYKAQDGSVSVAGYLVDSLDDGQGNPVCNTNGGVPTSRALALNAATQCRWGATFYQNHDFSLEHGACALAHKQPGATPASTHVVYHSLAYTQTFVEAMAAAGVERGTNQQSFDLVHQDGSPNVAVSWWYAMGAGGISALKNAAPSATRWTSTLFSNGYLRVDMQVRTDTGAMCPLVTVGVPGRRYATMSDSNCVANFDLFVSHHFYALATTDATTGAVTIQVWIDGFRAFATTQLPTTLNAPNVLQPATEHMSGYPTMTAGAINVRAIYSAADDLRVYTGDLAGVTDVSVKQTTACMPPKLFGSACIQANDTVVTLYQDHRSSCTSALTRDSVVLFATELAGRTQAQKQALVQGAMTGAWSMTAWVRDPGTPSSTALLMAQSTVSLLRRTSATGAVTLLVCVASACKQTAAFGNPGVRPMFVAIVYASAASYQVLVNGSPQTLVAATRPAEAAYEGATPYYSPLGGIEFVTLFDGVQLAASDVQQEQQCEVLSIYDVATISTESDWQTAWQAPYAMCTYVNSTLGHCRSPTMCGGNCLASATLDLAAGTFSVLRTVCDKGYAAPTCLAECIRVDPVSGYCLDSTNESARRTGAVPNGHRCTLMKNFMERTSSINGQRVVTYTPRVWSYLTTLTVPSGAITTLVNTGVCPMVSVADLGDGSLAIVMVNDNAGSVRTRVRYFYPDMSQLTEAEMEMCAPADGSDGMCCNYDGKVTQIAAYTSGRTTIPAACGTVTVYVERDVEGEFQACSELTADTIATMIVGSTTTSTLAIDARVSVAVDQVALDMTDQASSVLENILHVMVQAAISQGQSDNTVAYLTALTQSIASNQQPVVTYRNNLTTTYDLVNATLEAQILRGLADAQASLDLAANHTAQTTIDLAALAASIEAGKVILAANDVLAQDLAWAIGNATYGVHGSSSCGGSPFSVITCAIKTVVDVAKAAGEAAVGAAKDVAGATGDVGGGVLGGLFDGIWDLLMLCLLIAGIAGGIYLLYMCWKSNRQQQPQYQQFQPQYPPQQQFIFPPQKASGKARVVYDTLEQDNIHPF